MAEETNPIKETHVATPLETNPPGVDKLAPEAPPDDPTEAEDMGGETPLHELLLKMAEDDKKLTREADLDELSRMSTGGAQVNAKDADGGTALHLAAANGLVEAAKRLIDSGANISEPDSEERQPLHRACSKGHVEVVNLLLSKGANTQITEEDGWSPLHMASRYGHTQVIRALLAKDKTNINARESLEGWTALHLAIFHGHSVAVSALLEEGANAGIQDNDNWTPLMTAIKQKHEGIVKELLKQKGSLGLETRNNSTHTPLLAASINGFSAGASLLIKAGADCNVQSGRSGSTPLIAASGWRYGEIVKALLEAAQTDVNIQDEDNWAALHYASNKGHSKIVDLLLQHKANVELVNDYGQTALHLASKKGHEYIVEQLLKAEATVDERDQDGKTALHLASGAGPEDCSEQDSDELGPDDLSLEERKKEEFGSGRYDAVVKLLLESGARPDAKTNKNETALHLAASRGDQTRLDLILASMEQKQLSTRNDQGRTAFYLACTGENPESAVEIFLKSDKLRTAEFGRSDGEDDEIKWAASYPETHEVAKWLMEERWERKRTPKPEGSDNWGVFEWAAQSRLPEVLSLLITKSPESPEIQGLVKSLLESMLEPKPKPSTQPANELREGTEQNKRHEVLSLLIANSSRTPDFEKELKADLKKTLNLALGKEVKQGARHRQLLQVLSLLIATFSGTPVVNEALKLTLELVKKPEEGTTYEQFSQVLWLLIANSLRTPDIDNALQTAWESTSELAKGIENRPQDPELASIEQKAPKAEARASSHKGKTKDPGTTKLGRETSQMSVPTAPTTRTGKDQIDYLHAIIDILRDPPFSQTHKDSKIDGPPKHNDGLSKILKDHEATIVQFYKDEGESGTFRRYRSLKEVIYGEGPEQIMERTISDFKKIFGKLPDSLKHLKAEPKFTWVHLPATNMVWMNDLFMRIMSYEECGPQQYHELKSFFRNSWVQVPDRTSSSRSMRPRTVIRRQGNEVSENQGNSKKKDEERRDNVEREEKGEEESGNKNKKEGKKEQGKDGGERSPKAKHETESEEDRRKKNKSDVLAASATYMPYFCFSTKYRNENSLDDKQQKFKDMKMTYEKLKGTQSPVIHESPTLDEWYYHFAADEESTKDRDHRNETQTVTKAMKGNKIAKERGESTRREDKPSEWTLIRVNQLWAWTIANKWLITATPTPFDDSNGTLVKGILDQLGREVEAGGSASQPETASDMSRFVVDYCISTYERLPNPQKPKPQEPKSQQSKPEESKPEESKPQSHGSIRQIFSNTINQIGRDEASLFDDFRNQTERWLPGGSTKATKHTPSPRDKTSPQVSSDTTSEVSVKDLTYEDIRDAIKRAEKLYCDIKDIRDELNILKSAAQHQQTVEKGLTGESQDADLAAAYIVKDLIEMDNSAERIESAINTTLSLLQSRLSNHMADLATQQGKTLMAFTVVTILFLPLSFLSSLFALDVASFQQAPGWAFAVIFAVSFTFSIITALVAQHWETIPSRLRHLVSKAIKTGRDSPKKESVKKAKDKGIMGKSLTPCSEPATGDTDSYQQPFFSGLRGRLRRRQSDEEVARRTRITHGK